MLCYAAQGSLRTTTRKPLHGEWGTCKPDPCRHCNRGRPFPPVLVTAYANQPSATPPGIDSGVGREMVVAGEKAPSRRREIYLKGLPPGLNQRRWHCHPSADGAMRRLQNHAALSLSRPLFPRERPVGCEPGERVEGRRPREAGLENGRRRLSRADKEHERRVPT